MKKKYVKPYLLVEPYQLDAAYAEACSSKGYVSINHYADACSAWGGRFYADTDYCETDVVTGRNEDGDEICYHGPLLSEGVTFTWS